MDRVITVKFPEQLNKRLERAAPDYLRGPRCVSRRIEWAIHNLLELLDQETGDSVEH